MIIYNAIIIMKKAPHGSKNKGPSASPLKSKPFCDCRICECRDCPDILNLLGIKVTEKSCDFGSKVAKGKDGTGKEKKEEDQITLSPSLLDIVNQERDCACEIMARTVRSHVHMNLGLAHRRDALTGNPDPSDPSNSSTQ